MSVGDGGNCHESRLLQQFAGFCEPSRDLDQGEREREECQTETKVIRGFTGGREERIPRPEYCRVPFQRRGVEGGGGVTKFPAAAGEKERTFGGGLRRESERRKGNFQWTRYWIFEGVV